MSLDSDGVGFSAFGLEEGEESQASDDDMDKGQLQNSNIKSDVEETKNMKRGELYNTILDLNIAVSNSSSHMPTNMVYSDNEISEADLSEQDTPADLWMPKPSQAQIYQNFRASFFEKVLLNRNHNIDNLKELFKNKLMPRSTDAIKSIPDLIIALEKRLIIFPSRGMLWPFQAIGNNVIPPIDIHQDIHRTLALMLPLSIGTGEIGPLEKNKNELDKIQSNINSVSREKDIPNEGTMNDTSYLRNALELVIEDLNKNVSNQIERLKQMEKMCGFLQCESVFKREKGYILYKGSSLENLITNIFSHLMTRSHDFPSIEKLCGAFSGAGLITLAEKIKIDNQCIEICSNSFNYVEKCDISDSEVVASYNWEENEDIIGIIIPGSAPILDWTNFDKKIKMKKLEDESVVNIDLYKNPSYPTEALFRSLDICGRNHHLRSTNIIADRNILKKLYKFVANIDDYWDFKGYGSILNGTLILTRSEDKVVEKNANYTFSFEQKFKKKRNNRDSMLQTTSHNSHRYLVKITLGGTKLLVLTNADAVEMHNAGKENRVRMEEGWQNKVGSNLLHKKSNEEMINYGQIYEFKTNQWHKKFNDSNNYSTLQDMSFMKYWEIQYVQMLLGGVSFLIVGWHKNGIILPGKVDCMNLEDVRRRLGGKKVEEIHKNLGKLEQLLKELLKCASSSIKCSKKSSIEFVCHWDTNPYKLVVREMDHCWIPPYLFEQTNDTFKDNSQSKAMMADVLTPAELEDGRIYSNIVETHYRAQKQKGSRDGRRNNEDEISDFGRNFQRGSQRSHRENRAHIGNIRARGNKRGTWHRGRCIQKRMTGQWQERGGGQSSQRNQARCNDSGEESRGDNLDTNV